MPDQKTEAGFTSARPAGITHDSLKVGAGAGAGTGAFPWQTGSAGIKKPPSQSRIPAVTASFTAPPRACVASSDKPASVTQKRKKKNRFGCPD
ncbi:hypothetical protein CSUB01_08727 [Colletotrichum sublineola]|uniref:Uncharacterized protein n=1 Tax=Colletotrichum sublineola TaxID=1173701 RepID=A0A066X8A9_COLSU|nr:hypothetical protein CSUB01_08727 [Colletotrichum sublineola]